MCFSYVSFWLHLRLQNVLEQLSIFAMLLPLNEESLSYLELGFIFLRCVKSFMINMYVCCINYLAFLQRTTLDDYYLLVLRLRMRSRFAVYHKTTTAI
jgi:hypothetical protein